MSRSRSPDAEVVAEREIRCFLGWSRRNVYPPHPNIHSDPEFARERGFDGAIMSASQLVPHLHETLIDAIGEQAFFSRARVRYKMVRPLPSEGRAFARVLRGCGEATFELRIEDEGGALFVVGSAELEPASSG